jgi:phospholipase C
MSKNLPDIRHVIVLMLENRSFDHMLGYLHSDTYDISGIDRNNPPSNFDADGHEVVVTPDAGYFDLDDDPGHSRSDVAQQLGSSENPNSGFVKNYALYTSKSGSHKVMRCFDPLKKVPILATLAQQYAVCYHWFASMPGPTIPNRLFAYAATSLGITDQTVDPFSSETPTIFEEMDARVTPRVSSALYVHNGDTLAPLFFNYVLDHIGYLVKPFGEFETILRRKTADDELPQYCFLEPRYSDQDNGNDLTIFATDQHPPHNVQHGEQLIADVYNLLRANEKLWKSTLLIITYDEHGGIFDHVAPPPVPWPADGGPRPDPPFDRYGVRVPAVLVSPYIAKGTRDPQVYDHTSIMKTARQLLYRTTEDKARSLTMRDKLANSFEGNLTPTFRDDTPKRLRGPWHRLALASLIPGVVRDESVNQHRRQLVQRAFAIDQRHCGGRIAGTRDLNTLMARLTNEREAIRYTSSVIREFRPDL